MWLQHTLIPKHSQIWDTGGVGLPMLTLPAASTADSGISDGACSFIERATACAGGAGAAGTAAQPPDLGACLLQQKLQMVALCIARRAAARRGGTTTPTTAAGPREFGAQLSLGSGASWHCPLAGLLAWCRPPDHVDADER